MKVKQIIYFSLDSYCFGIRHQLELSDPEGNEIILELEEGDIKELESLLEYKANMIREEGMRFRAMTKRLQEAKDHTLDLDGSDPFNAFGGQP